MALNFPSSPSANATYTFNDKTWTYTGNAWYLTSGGALSTSVVPEGTNLYFSNARVYSNIVALGYVTIANVNAILASTGNIIPSGNNIQTLGNATNRFKDLYLSGNTIFLGDILLKTSNSSFQVSDTSNNIIFNAVDATGFTLSTVYAFPGSTGNTDYGNLISIIDAFGVSTSNTYTLMEPNGKNLTTDLGIL